MDERAPSEDVTVVTVDDQPAFRRAAREVIAATPGFRPVGEAASGEEALRLVDDLGPELVLLDLRMPGMDGVETARLIAARRPRPVVVIVTAESGEALPGDAAGCGAAALARKQDFGRRLLRELWSAHGRGTPEPPRQ
jgi:DNA-binding NarL/FixJ family response regulator